MFQTSERTFFPVSGKLDSEDAIDRKNTGMVLVETMGTASTGWNFIFPLEGYDDPKHEHFLPYAPHTEIFGHVLDLHMLDSFNLLSTISKRDRKGYKLTLETRN